MGMEQRTPLKGLVESWENTFGKQKTTGRPYLSLIRSRDEVSQGTALKDSGRPLLAFLGMFIRL
jgi:hypothetical protein